MGKILAVVAIVLIGCSVAQAKPVKGYVKKDGTSVRPHARTGPNHTQRDNFSTKGNRSPTTGKAGTRTPKR